jgi:hypothetical protein
MPRILRTHARDYTVLLMARLLHIPLSTVEGGEGNHFCEGEWPPHRGWLSDVERPDAYVRISPSWIADRFYRAGGAPSVVCS